MTDQTDPVECSLADFQITDDDNPDHVDRFWLKRGESRVDYMIQWTGDLYPSASCWISVDTKFLVNLGANL